MESSEPPAVPQRERADTDAKLRAEREETDRSLEQTRQVAEREAEALLLLARQQAELIVHTARVRADSGRFDTVEKDDWREELSAERDAEDRVLAKREAEASRHLRMETEEQERALAALIKVQRNATDHGLVAERRRADKAVATRDEFLGMVSHDLRNLLNVIALRAVMLTKHAAAPNADGYGDEVTLRHAQRIQRSTLRMNRLLSDMIDVLSLEAGRLPIVRARFDAILLVTDAIEAFQPCFDAKGITLVSEVADEPLPISADQDRIMQVLGNLLTNALNFTTKGGRVMLSLRRRGGELLFTVTDTGEGIPSDQLATIFDRFHQVAPKDRRGLGLGLYIAKSIVDAHGGQIWANNEPSGGAALHFKLPAG